jgi:predicted NAD/FAD-dependent oxidoreductase
MSPAWSRDRYDDPLEAVAPDAADRVADLVGVDWLRDPTWADDQGWRYALPDDVVDPDAPAVETARDAGLHLVGDWVAGAGRVHEALWNGVAAGERLRERP